MAEQYKRAVAVKFGGASTVVGGEDPRYSIANLDDNGLRIAFKFRRTNRGEPDRGTVRIWNLNARTRAALADDLEIQRNAREIIQENPALPDDVRATQLKAVSDQYLVSVYAGYRGKPEIIFRGEVLNIKPRERDGSVDFVTTIELGDGLLALRDGYINAAFGGGATIERLLAASIGASGLDFDPASKAIISAVAPNAVVTATKEGIYAVGRPADVIDEVAELYGLQWWARDGKIFMVPQGAVTQDSTIVLQQGKDLLDYVAPEGFGDTRGRALLQPKLHPGRGLILLDNKGLPISAVGFRTTAVEYTGDTHGTDFFVDFEATESTQAIAAPTVEFDA